MKPAEYARMRRYVGTQKEVAGRLGVHEMTLSKRERGEVEIDLEAVIAMRAIYDMEKALDRMIECEGCGKAGKLRHMEAAAPDKWICTRCAARLTEAYERGMEAAKPKKRTDRRRRFDDAHVLEMRAKYEDGASLYGLAKEYGVTAPAVRKAVTGESYGHVPGAVTLRG